MCGPYSCTFRGGGRFKLAYNRGVVYMKFQIHSLEDVLLLGADHRLSYSAT